MRIAQAIRKFATVPLEGWNGTAWEATGVSGDFHAYDRFITHRTFGAVKRVFLTPEPIPSQYEVVRIPGGNTFLSAYVNPDVIGLEIYAHSYLFHEANFDIEILGYTTTDAASGMGRAPQATVTATVRGDIERVTAERSLEFNTVKYTQSLFALPRSAPVDEDSELRVDGRVYRIKEVFIELNLLRAVGAKR